MVRRWMALIVAIGLLVGVLPAAAQAPADNPAEATYAARGPYPVGTFDLTIEARYAPNDREEPLPATVWYPALNPDGLPEETTYTWADLTLDGQALRDAAPDPSGGPYPLVIFSHGLGGLRFQSRFYTEHLASYGFVVIAIDHPGSTLEDAGADRSGDFDVTRMLVNYGYRPLDVLRALNHADRLTAPDGRLAGMIDTARTAVSGHSFGGYTALAAAGARLDFGAFNDWCARPEALVFDPAAEPALAAAPATAGLGGTSCFMRLMGGQVATARGLDSIPDGLWPATTDPRIQAVIALAPWNVPVFGAEGVAAIDIPIMVQVGSGDTTTPPARDAYAAYANASSADKALVVYDGAGHGVFADEFPDGFDAVWAAEDVHPLINHFATAFLLAELTGDAEAAAALDPAAVAFDGVQYAAAWGE